MSLTLHGLTKAFGRYPAVTDVSLDIGQGELLALLGPSGSGKTTLLRILAGLESPDRGDVRFEGQDFLALSARERRVGMVFQHYALFRHMTVAGNVAFGLEVRSSRERPRAVEIRSRVADLLRLVQLEGLGDRYPGQLSGGQRQRVALARALAIEPRLLLLDEPFGALDAKVRRELRRWLRRLHDETGVTTIFVTHDQEEALDLADRIAILHRGQLAQVGAPAEVYDAPNSAFVFDFLGESCRLAGTVEGGRLRVAGWETPAPGEAPQEGPVEVFFRPEDANPADSGDGIAARVRNVASRGPSVRVECLVGTEAIELAASGAAADFLAPGRLVRLRPSRLRVFPRATA